MALIYLVPFLLLLQAGANPLDSTDMTSTEIPFFGNETSELENATDATVFQLGNLTSVNETEAPIDSTEDMSTVATSQGTEIDTMPSTSEPEATEPNPPPTKKANIKNLAVMAQAGALAIVLPVCVRLVTLWNRCL